MNLQNAVAVVTGGAQNIGLGIARELVARGSRVVILDVSPLDEQDSQSERLTGWVCDVSNPAEVNQALTRLHELYGRLDLVVNAAGWIYSSPVFNLMNKTAGRHDQDAWDKVLRTNLTTTFVMGSHAIEWMAKSRTKGLIVNISSVAAAGNAGQSAYSAAKAGVNALTVTWAKELGALGIRCIAVAPGFIDTPTTHGAMTDERLRAWISKVPLRRLGQINDIAQAVVFAAENDYVNGTVLEINGGLTL